MGIHMLKTGGIVLAAGLSSRMGDFKPLLKIGNKVLIEATIDTLLEAGINEIVVVLGYRGSEIQAYLSKHTYARQITFAYNENYATTDMLESIRIGIRKLGECDAFFILPGDMPAVKNETFQLLKNKMQEVYEHTLVAFPTVSHSRKHPPLVSIKCRQLILEYEGTNGLRGFWSQIEDKSIYADISDDGCALDADTRQDYEKLVNYMKI